MNITDEFDVRHIKRSKDREHLRLHQRPAMSAEAPYDHPA
jgi:hypothetical protein